MSSLRAARSHKTSTSAKASTTAKSASSAAPTIPEVVIGRIVGFKNDAVPLVEYPGNPMHWPLEAVTTAALSGKEINRDVALLFANGDATRPVVIGVVQAPSEQEAKAGAEGGETPQEVRVDGQRVVLRGEQEVVLECGAASITLTKAGKILVRGAYLSSRSSGVNRIKGGSVQIN